MSRIVSIDYGQKRIGLAITDERKTIASPFKTLLTHKTLPLTIDALLKILQPYDIELIIVGFPLHLNGSKSPLCLEIERFIQQLQEKVPYKILSIDERLTTAQAEKTLSSISRKKRAPIIDQVAAALLLESYLNSLEWGSSKLS